MSDSDKQGKRPSRFSTERLARACAEHPKRTIGIWVAILVASLGIIGTLLANVLTSEYTFANEPEAVQAKNQMETLGFTDQSVETVVFSVTDGSLRSPDKLRAIDGVADEIRAIGPEVVLDVVAPSANPAALVSESGNAAIVRVAMTGDINNSYETIPQVLEVTERNDGLAGMDVRVTGLASINEALNTHSQEDLKVGETFGIGLGLLILLAVFGALAAALVPVMLAIVAIIMALALTALIGQLNELSLFVTNMITMMGLALGIDYALFIVSRFREERAAGVPKLDAIERAGATSMRAVFFSGLTVVVALAGLLIVPLSIFSSLGLGAILVALSAVAAALTLLPALLSLVGDRINAGRLPWFGRERPPGEHGLWGRLARGVMRRPLLSFSVTAAVLIAASIPYWTMVTGASGVAQMPSTTDARSAYELMLREFPTSGLSTLSLPAIGSDEQTADEIVRVLAVATTEPELGEPRVLPSRTDVEGSVIEIPLLIDAASAPATRVVRQLRESSALPVGGLASFNVDYFDVSSDYLPIVVAIVLVFSFCVLLLAFRSLVAAIKALILNLLSVGAAFGLLTLVCQKGFGTDLLGYQQVQRIEAWLPLFLFAVLFGLSMDYHVFLLSRIREHYLVEGDNEASIVHGITSSARLITGAALIMVAVFMGFSMGNLAMFQQMGFGLGIAVLLDATLVRGILVPAAMRMLGSANWYLPSWLEWLPKISIDGPPSEPRAAREPAASTVD